MVAPKKPDELREQVERQNRKPAAPGREYTAEGMATRVPERDEFFENLEKLAKPERAKPDSES